MTARRVTAWSNDDHDTLVYFAATKTADELAEMLGRARGSIIRRAYRFGIRIAGQKTYQRDLIPIAASDEGARRDAAISSNRLYIAALHRLNVQREARA